MELFNSIVVPVPGAHLTLINWLLAMVLAIYFVYGGLILGSMLMSMFNNMRFKKTGEDFYQRLARDYANLFTSTPTLWFGGGMMPMLAALLIYSQLQSGLQTHTVSYMLVAFLFFSAGLAAIYIYKNSFNFMALFEKASSKVDIVEFKEEGHNANAIRQSSGFWALLFLLAGSWIFNTAIAMGNNPEMLNNNSFFNLFSFDNILRNIHFITAGLTLTGASFVYMKYQWEGGVHFGNVDYSNFAKKKNLSLALIFLIFQPLFIGLNSFRIQDPSNSMFSWIITAITFIVIFYVAHLFSLMNKNNSNHYIKYAFYLLIFSIGIGTLNDSINFQTNNHTNFVLLADNYDNHRDEVEKAKQEEAGETPEISGKEVYDTRCSACHKFDKKQLTAPAYNDVVPKYKNDLAGLVSFIEKPTKVNTEEYPQGMAALGLSPDELNAVAKYVLETALANTGQSSEDNSTEEVEASEDEDGFDVDEETTDTETEESDEPAE